MRAVNVRVSERAVLTAAYGGAVVVVVCGGLGLIAGIERAVRDDRWAEGAVIVALSTMIAAVSLAVLLFVAWSVTSGRVLHDPQPGTGSAPPSDDDHRR